METHKKHSNLTKRKYGNFAQNEIAILGTNCNTISELVQNIINTIQNKYKIAYVDASHNKEIEKPEYDIFTFHHSGQLVTTSATVKNRYNEKILFSAYDFLFVNGNHYQAEQQVLVIDSDKEASILKRVDQLSNVQFLILKDNKAKIFDFLVKKYPEIKNLKSYSIKDIKSISTHIENIIKQKIAKISGLVLAGGKSVRMGSDKGLLKYHGKSQRNYAIDLLERLQLKTYLSVRKEQLIEIENKIEDVFIGLGPFGAICSAFRFNPNNAWLVLATDLPFVDEEVLKLLLENRDPSKIATAIKGKNKQFPEPLITIWEPKAYPILLEYLAQGISCPRKVLINSDVKLIEMDDNLITNVNTPNEFEQVKKKLNA